jgi:hypothetical protein
MRHWGGQIRREEEDGEYNVFLVSTSCSNLYDITCIFFLYDDKLSQTRGSIMFQKDIKKKISLRGHHGLEEGQRHCRAGSSNERPPGKMLLRDDPHLASLFAP